MLKITVSGKSKSGKSTIAHTLRSILSTAGFQVEITDEHTKFDDAWLSQQRQRLFAIFSKDQRILIVTENTDKN